MAEGPVAALKRLYRRSGLIPSAHFMKKSFPRPFMHTRKRLRKYFCFFVELKFLNGYKKEVLDIEILHLSVTEPQQLETRSS